MEEMTRAPVSAESGEWTRVIVLTPRGSQANAEHPDPAAFATHARDAPAANSLPDSLRAAFAARDWFAVTHDDPYLALADLALRDLTQTARAAWGLQRLERLALVIVQPAGWPEAMLEDLVDAAVRYLPTASIWHARDGQITAALAAPRETSRIRSSRPLPPRSACTDPAERNGPPAEATPRCAEPVGRISRAEIDMLLKADDSTAASGDHQEERR